MTADRLSKALRTIACHLPNQFKIPLLRFAGMELDARRIGDNVYFDYPRNIKIGSVVLINSNTCFYAGWGGRIEVGDRVYIGPNCSLCTFTHDIGDAIQRAGKLHYSDISIEEGAWLGMNVTVLPGVHIASGCVIAAGSVVINSTFANGLYGGVPAERIKDL